MTDIEYRFAEAIAEEMSLEVRNVAGVIELLNADCTIPFIARYRKEVSGEMDEVQVGNVKKRLEALRKVEARREAIIEAIEKQDAMTESLLQDLFMANTLTELADLYLPFRPKRTTRADTARSKGLQPLADAIQQESEEDVNSLARQYVSEQTGIKTVEDALRGARYIVASEINENPSVRAYMRKYFERNALITATKTDTFDPNGKYARWDNWKEPASKAPSHRILALFRAERKKELTIRLMPEYEQVSEEIIVRFLVHNRSSSSGKQKKLAAIYAYKHHLAPSLETEMRKSLKARANNEAIAIFAQNLHQLLMAPPLGEKSVLAIDPGYRTGCKCVCLSPQGKLLYHFVIFLTEEDEARELLCEVVEQYSVEAIAVGSGTASKETMRLVKSVEFKREVIISLVNEDGASVYSASEAAREELGDYDITVRGAVSIGRRLQDPLAELVKIEPRSIGVGQYQHDVDSAHLCAGLDEEVERCVNRVGVELNTASRQLLSRVSGVGTALANNIVEYRNGHGTFSSRQELLKVRGFGTKTFEQAAGFLRVGASKNPLDNTSVHPERYALVKRMAKDAGCTVKELIDSAELRSRIVLSRYESADCGMPTLKDIMDELSRPGRDIRTEFSQTELNSGINSLEDLHEGMWVEGIVSNITAFGAFIDLGIHESGLLHISKIRDRFLSNISEVLHIGQRIGVRVEQVDYASGKISLSRLSYDKNVTKHRKNEK